LAPGGEWLIWDALVPARAAGADNSFLINLHTKLPKETIDYGYSVLRLDFARDTAYYRGLAERAGFQVAGSELIGQNRKAFFLRLRKGE
jgi:hypothetical protein